MRKIACFIGCILFLSACDKHDPILPGVRTAIFDAGSVTVLHENVPDLPETIDNPAPAACPYRQDSSNVIWRGDKKIFSGFPTSNSVKSDQSPVCSGRYVYAGLTTGELVKVNGQTRQIVWIADIYRASNLTGGASVLDIVAPIVLRGDYVYAGSIGDAFCKINAGNGAKKWCADIGTAMPFIVADNVVFVAGVDNHLYALRVRDGVAYWRAPIKNQAAPRYENKIIYVGTQKFNAENGSEI